jgi:hypothetical protein
MVAVAVPDAYALSVAQAIKVNTTERAAKIILFIPISQNFSHRVGQHAVEALELSTHDNAWTFAQERKAVLFAHRRRSEKIEGSLDAERRVVVIIAAAFLLGGTDPDQKSDLVTRTARWLLWQCNG